MSNYTFSSINDKEFELLVLDLLNAKYSLNLQVFKVGPDQGIDLRYSTAENNNQIVVQAKHYIGSGYSKLKKVFVKKELSKLKSLNPQRYIIATSLPLSPKQKDELKDLLSPYILSSNDVIGQSDLNTYLREFKEIEQKQFKLWFSSVSMLNAILNNAIEGRTRAYLEKIRSKIGLYVVTKSLDKANELLDKKKLLLITGQPGLGKTTLADAILLERAKKGHHIYKVVNIREAEDMISLNNNVKQLFYFDDFLGETYYEILTAGQTETQITQFVDRVRNTPNKYLMLTSRTVILNQADDKSEKINRSQLLNQQYEIQLSDYSKFEKAEILYNHLYFYEVKEELFNSIIQDKFYKTIINHESYTPRTIEFLTEPTKIENLSPTEYREFITASLKNPKEIWSRSFRNQINYFDQLFLVTLFTFRGKVNEMALIAAYESRLQYEKINHNQIIKANQFWESAKILLNGFITSTLIDAEETEREYSFINPSLSDFFKGYVQDSFQERKAIVSSVIYIDQLNHFDPEHSSIPFEKELQLTVKEKMLSNRLDSLDKYKSYSFHGLMLHTLRKYCQDIDIDEIFIAKMDELDFKETWWIKDELIYCLLHSKNSPTITEYVKENFSKIINHLIKAIDEPEMARKLPELFNNYDQRYNQYFEDEEKVDTLSAMIKKAANYNHRIQKNLLQNSALNLVEVDKAYLLIHQADEALKNDLLPDIEREITFERDIDCGFWEEKIKANEIVQKEKINKAEKLVHYYKNSTLTAKNEEKAIDDLFYKADYNKVILENNFDQDETPF
jgi:energy-coupling factor transporter ATP-binding protein EcfA2